MEQEFYEDCKERICITGEAQEMNYAQSGRTSAKE